MTREEVIKIINDDPHLTKEQGAAIFERFGECRKHLLEEAKATAIINDGNPIGYIEDMFVVCFVHGYVYASLEYNGEVKV